MIKRSLMAILVIAALIIIPSCDAESFMRSFGTNILGGAGTEETVNAIDQQVDNIINYTDSGENYKELVKLVVQATKNPDTEEKMIRNLSQSVDDEKSKAVVESQISGVIDEINETFGNTEEGSKIDLNDFKSENINTVIGEINNSEQIPTSLKSTLITAANNISTLVDAVSGDSSDYKPTKGDVVILETVSNVVKDIIPVITDKNSSQETIDNVISSANEALKMFNTIKTATVFKDIDLNGVIDQVIASTSGSSTASGEVAG